MTRLDRRVARTRSALIEAFNHLVLVRRQRRIRVEDIVERANVGRSTFYEHYSSADELMLQALRRPMAAVADAAAGTGDLFAVTHILEHFWENRARAREILGGRLDGKVTRLLSSMIEERLNAREIALSIPLPLASRQLADAALAPIRGWVAADAPCAPRPLAEAICRCGEAMVGALAIPSG